MFLQNIPKFVIAHIQKINVSRFKVQGSISQNLFYLLEGFTLGSFALFRALLYTFNIVLLLLDSLKSHYSSHTPPAGDLNALSSLKDIVLIIRVL